VLLQEADDGKNKPMSMDELALRTSSAGVNIKYSMSFCHYNTKFEKELLNYKC